MPDLENAPSAAEGVSLPNTGAADMPQTESTVTAAPAPVAEDGKTVTTFQMDTAAIAQMSADLQAALASHIAELKAEFGDRLAALEARVAQLHDQHDSLTSAHSETLATVQAQGAVIANADLGKVGDLAADAQKAVDDAKSLVGDVGQVIADIKPWLGKLAGFEAKLRHM